MARRERRREEEKGIGPSVLEEKEAVCMKGGEKRRRGRSGLEGKEKRKEWGLVFDERRKKQRKEQDLVCEKKRKK